MGQKNKVSFHYYSRIKGDFEVNYMLLKKKILSCDLPIDILSLIMFNSFNEANHLETVEGKLDLFSFNSALANADTLVKLKSYST